MSKKGNISTKAGDKGTTRIGGGSRVDKDNIRVECLGDLDEANSTIGYLRSKLPPEHSWDEGLARIQTEMMNLMSHVATPSNAEKPSTAPLPTDTDKWMETWMEEIESALSSETVYFLLPGGNEISSLCHVSRTQIRRSERRLVSLNKEDPVDPSILRFVNRLSDLLFKLARQEMETSGLSEERWRLFKSK
ncbi:MAG: cob(I)yrinic acid a,c-diamide adenosyltransferase [Verrucomicrobiota bacterium]